MIVQKFQWIFQRVYSQEKFPKITTHYTIVPRELDQRWKGDDMIYKYEIKYNKYKFILIFINNELLIMNYKTEILNDL